MGASCSEDCELLESNCADGIDNDGKPIALPNGTQVDSNFADLIDNNALDSAINVNENGVLVGGTISVWTNTNPDGSPDGAGVDCNNWGQGGIPIGNTPVGNGASAAFPGWSDNGQASCTSTTRRLYCFQQN